MNMKNPGRGLLLAAAMGLPALLVPAAPADAQNVRPNYAKYCRTYYPGSIVNRFRGSNEPICTRIIGRYTRYHYRINIGEACRLTTGSRAFRRVGAGRYVCLGRRRGISRPTLRGRLDGPPNYAKYCRTYYPGSIVNYMRLTREPLCTRILGPLQRMHYRINIAQACRLTTGSPRYVRVASGQYRCFRR